MIARGLGIDQPRAVLALAHKHDKRSVDHHLLVIYSIQNKYFKRLRSIHRGLLYSGLYALSRRHDSIEETAVDDRLAEHFDGTVLVCAGVFRLIVSLCAGSYLSAHFPYNGYSSAGAPPYQL